MLPHMLQSFSAAGISGTRGTSGVYSPPGSLGPFTQLLQQQQGRWHPPGGRDGEANGDLGLLLAHVCILGRDQGDETPSPTAWGSCFLALFLLVVVAGRKNLLMVFHSGQELGSVSGSCCYCHFFLLSLL